MGFKDLQDKKPSKLLFNYRASVREESGVWVVEDKLVELVNAGHLEVVPTTVNFVPGDSKAVFRDKRTSTYFHYSGSARGSGVVSESVVLYADTEERLKMAAPIVSQYFKEFLPVGERK